jgi:hypothetical protein
VVCMYSMLGYGMHRVGDMLNMHVARLDPQSIIFGDDTPLFFDECEASPIFRKLLDFGLKELRGPRVVMRERCRSQSTDSFAKTLVLPVVISTPLFGKTVIDHAQKRIYILPRAYVQPYGVKKAVVLHELMHTIQQYHINGKLIPRDAIRYVHYEQEADSEALHHISCKKCCDEFARSRSGCAGLLERLRGYFGVQDNFHGCDSKGYVNYMTACAIAREKTGICSYHEELTKHALHKIGPFVTPLFALGCFLMIKNNATLSMIEKCDWVMMSAVHGFGIAQLLRVYIERAMEDKVALGVIEP